jgi:NAD(P)-dependent dehydrogenase (short-subunit alcohol dehydrogenase family)
MSEGLRDQVVLVTGAGGSIGGAVTRAAIAAGARVLGVDRNLGTLPEILPEHDLFAVDVGDWDAWERIELEIGGRFGRIDGLVSAAAVMHPRDGNVLDVNREVWQETLQSNLTGALLASKVAVRLMKDGGGSIVHLASTVAHLGSAEPQLAYTASKGGILALARELAVAQAPSGIRVNLVSPGLVSTPLTSHLVSDRQALERRLDHIPLRRLGEPEEVAEAVVWLLSQASRYVTGAEIIVDGGMTAAFLTNDTK